jgi:hypothetical protein
MKKIIIILLVLFVIVALIFMIQNVYTPTKKIQYRYSPTDFIEPDGNFIKCYKDDDCIKVKGSACPVGAGGTETCINKNYIQEYNSKIENLAGKEWEVACPSISRTDNYGCACVNNVCELKSLGV